MLADSYGSYRDLELTNCRSSATDPPDLVCSAEGLTVGLEVTEVEAFYEERALLVKFEDLAYREFAKAIDDDRYLGLRIQLPILIDKKWQRKVEAAWTTAKLSNPLKRAAEELFRLVIDNFPSASDVPDGDLGAVFRIDADKYRALAIVAPYVTCTRYPPTTETELRSDGRMCPLIVAGGATNYSANDLIEFAIKTVAKKLVLMASPASRQNWEQIDRSILVAHDLPRSQMYQGFVINWEAPLTVAGTMTRVLDYFDELWLVTWRNLKGRAIPILPPPPPPPTPPGPPT